ncbi:MAG: tetratricopeptide repeat protein [Proteobacteria bacterium]|nr:tetratricopeptide repeat protein [Pseudomonadota bacterium]
MRCRAAGTAAHLRHDDHAGGFGRRGACGRWSSLGSAGLSVWLVLGCGGGSADRPRVARAPTSAPRPAVARATQVPMPAPHPPPEPVAVSPSPKTPAPAEASSKPSPWGDPEQETGRPLPPRRALTTAGGQLLDQAMAAADAGDVNTARLTLERALQADPNSPKLAYNLGVLADRSGQENQALQYYRRALQVQPDYEKAAEGIVRFYLRRGAVREAVAFMAPLASSWVRNLYLQALYSSLLTRAGRLDEAEAAARKALRRDERFVPAMIALLKAARARGRAELADSMLQQAMGVTDQDAELHFLLGAKYKKDGRLADALKAFRKAVELRPDYPEARMELGLQYMAGGNYSQALAEFEHLVRLTPGVAAVHLNLGDAYRSTKQWQLAKASFDEALRLQPNLPEVHFNLALMYMSAGADYPGLDQLTALRQAVSEFTNYRHMKGPSLSRDDPSEGYLQDLQRGIEREQRRIEREKKRKQRETERAARRAPSGQPTQGAAADQEPTPASVPAPTQQAPTQQGGQQ